MTCRACTPTSPTSGLCSTHHHRLTHWGTVAADIPIAKAVQHTIVGCGTCGAGDVRPAPCQAWCWTQRFPVVRRRRRRKVAA